MEKIFLSREYHFRAQRREDSVYFLIPTGCSKQVKALYVSTARETQENGHLF